VRVQNRLSRSASHRHRLSGPNLPTDVTTIRWNDVSGDLEKRVRHRIGIVRTAECS
jgi:hypothetical protein